MSYRASRSSYSKLDDATPLFEVSLEKKCRSFPFLWTPECAQAAERGEFTPCACRSMGPEGTPNHAYRGCPASLQFEYTVPGSVQSCAPDANTNRNGVV